MYVSIRPLIVHEIRRPSFVHHYRLETASNKYMFKRPQRIPKTNEISILSKLIMTNRYSVEIMTTSLIVYDAELVNQLKLLQIYRSMTVSFLALPLDILLCISAFLTNPLDLLSLSQVGLHLIERETDGDLG